MANFDEVLKHRAAIQRYLVHMLGDAGEAEDLTQETLLRAHQNWTTLQQDSALLGWLYRIATNAALDHLRQRSRFAPRVDDRTPEELEAADQTIPSALKVVQQEEMGACVQQYVSELPDEYRSVLLLHEAAGLTAPEIAKLLGLPRTTVKMRLHRARQRLQKSLRNACEFAYDERGVVVCDPKSTKR